MLLAPHFLVASNTDCLVAVFCTCDIYCTSVRPRERDPSSAVLSEVSYFSLILSIDSGFLSFSSPGERV